MTKDDNWRQYYSCLKDLPIAGTCGLQKMLFTVGLFIGLDSEGCRGRYCFHTVAEAEAALESWDGSGHPAGNWIKYKGLGGPISNPDYTQPKKRTIYPRKHQGPSTPTDDIML